MTIARRMIVYLGTFSVVLGAWLAAPSLLRPRSYSVPSGKVVSYLDHKKKYDLVFVGDSRTYTDIQPRILGPLVGRRAYNMASFGLWMPVQYLEFQDLFGRFPANTVVVWSLSPQNFVPIGDRMWIPGQYKFGLSDLIEYVYDGYPLPRIIQEYEEAPFSPFDLAARFRKSISRSFATVIWRAGQRGSIPNRTSPAGYRIPTVNVAFSRAEANRAKAERIIENLKHDPSVTIAAPVMADGMVTSVELTRSDGGYERIIIDREFFRAQQAKLWPRNSEALGCHFVPSKLYMSTFNKILDLAGKHRLRVIVNLIEDAPGSWTSDSERKCSREFMFSTIVPMLSKRGMSFVAPDFYPLIDYNNDWYFDNSHLISEGAAIYSRLLAKEIKSTLEERKW